MPTEKTIKGKSCRYYKAGSVWVSEDGTIICYLEKSKQLFKPDHYVYPRKKKLPDGRLYVENRFQQIVPIDRAVFTCWCPPIPKDGKKYMLNHKDGNVINSHRYNLEAIPYHYEPATSDKTKLFIMGQQIIEVHKDGTFWQDGSQLSVNDYGYDPDTDRHYYRGNRVYIHFIKGYINGYPMTPEQLMEEAGYVNGDDAEMKNPVVLHRDLDPLNWASGNLEFVEADDPRYQEYSEKLEEYRDQRVQEINKEFN